MNVAGCTIPVDDEAAAVVATPATPDAATIAAEVPPNSTTVAIPAGAASCPLPASRFDCDLQRRIAGVEAYLAQRPGTVGFVLRDRQTGAVYANEHADTLVWTASTIKLAMVVDLLTRERRGELVLDDDDREFMRAMLHSSDNDATDALWSRYSGPDSQSFNAGFSQYGMTDLAPQSPDFPYWGFQKCTAADLDRLMQHTLIGLAPEDSAYVITEMQNVAENQQWGVWAAGPDAQPGNKDGWSDEDSGWVVNSVGFAGPDQRYTLAIMSSLDFEGGFDDGVATDSGIAELLLGGRD